jgi:hypothetical protein
MFWQRRQAASKLLGGFSLVLWLNNIFKFLVFLQVLRGKALIWLFLSTAKHQSLSPFIDVLDTNIHNG